MGAARDVHILMSINEPDISRVLSIMMRNRLSSSFKLKIADVSLTSEILARARTQTIGLFVLLLNNLRIDRAVAPRASSSTWPPLQFLMDLKEEFTQPIIALTGYWPDQPTMDHARAVADSTGGAFFTIPVDSASLAWAVRKALGEFQGKQV
jgi:hypothetical protein